MPPYRASMGGIAGSGVYDTGRRGPEWDKIIDALSGGASSLIRQLYMRKLAQQQMARDERQDVREEEKAGLERQRAGLDREKFSHEQAMDRAQLLEKGYHDQPHQRKAPNILKAMMGPGAEGMPDTFDVTQTEPHYDLERSVPYRTAVDRAGVSGQLAEQRQRERLQAAQQGRAFMAQSQRDLARLRASLARNNGTGGGVNRAMTAGQRETMLQKTAMGLLAQTNGSYDDAIDLLDNTPEGNALKQEGLEARHLMIAHGAYKTGAVNQVIRFQTQGGMSAPEAAAARDSTMRLVAPTRKPAAGVRAKADTTKKLTTPAAPAAPTAPAAKTDTTKKPALKSAPKQQGAAQQMDESKLSDADLWEKKKKDGMSVSEATAYVKNRKKK